MSPSQRQSWQINGGGATGKRQREGTNGRNGRRGAEVEWGKGVGGVMGGIDTVKEELMWFHPHDAAISRLLFPLCSQSFLPEVQHKDVSPLRLFVKAQR